MLVPTATRKLEAYLASLPTRALDIPAQPESAQAASLKKKKKVKKPSGNQPQMELATELKRICGVDLTSIDGIDVMTSLTIVSEIGTDMSRFNDEDHFASWLGLTPSKDISAGKTVGRGKRKVKSRLATALRTAATTLLRSDTYLGARYRNLRRQLPTLSAAVKAMGRHLAVLIYRLLTKGEAWVDRGATQFERRRTEQELANLNFRAQSKGFKLVPITEAS
jgi:hypothetical protein